MKNDINKVIEKLGTTKFNAKTILITGGAGFLGSWLCDALIELGAKVICLDNLCSGLRQNIAHLLSKPNFSFIEHDIAQPLSLNKKVDMVMHLASRASPFEFEKYPLEILRANTLGTLNALEIVRENKALFLYASTSEIYGNPSLVPTPESYYGNVNPVGARGCYDESKRCGEAYAVAYHNQYGLDIRIARIFNTYGPRMRADDIYGRVIPRFIDQALKKQPLTIFGDGKQTRSFCYVTDQVEGLLRLAYMAEGKGEIVNIGSDKEVSIIDLARLVTTLTGSASELSFHPLPEDDPQRRCPDITRAKAVLGWQPEVTLETGLTRTIDWFQSSSPVA